MVAKFRQHIADSTKNSETIDRILEILAQHRPVDEPVDVELLLETLERLEKRDEEVALWFYEPGKYKLEGYSAKRPLAIELKDFIKRSAIVEASKIRYLEAFLEFIEGKSLDIFSVNYDTCIEQFCDTYRKDLQDGFDIYWNPETFKRKTSVRLYKLHGSVTWYRSDKGRYLKIPIISESSTIELASREKAESLVLYPFHKWTYAEPMLELLVELKRKLDVASYVFVVGYSFRDDHIRRLFWDAANKNRDLVVFLIGPNAREIFRNKLRYYDRDSSSIEPAIPSSLEGRVILLPYKFEDVLPKLKNQYLYDLSLGQRAELDARTSELSGQPANWTGAFWYFAKCEYGTKITQLLDRVEWSSIDAARGTEISFEIMVSALCQDDRDLARPWSEKFVESTPWLEAPSIAVQVAVSPPRITLRFCSKNNYIPVTQVKNIIEVLEAFTNSRISMVPSQRKQRLQNILNALNRISEYITHWRDDGIEHTTYMNLRKDKYPAQIKEIGDSLRGLLSPNYDPNAVKVVIDRIEQIEKVIFAEIADQLRQSVS